MEEHLAEKRLSTIVEQQARFAEPELDHIEKCGECLETYARLILQDARSKRRVARE
jgi:hypothetical protein